MPETPREISYSQSTVGVINDLQGYIKDMARALLPTDSVAVRHAVDNIIVKADYTQELLKQGVIE